MLAVYRAGHREQRMNARLVEAAGVGQAGRLPLPASYSVDRFLRRIEERAFTRIDLAAALPPVSEALVDHVCRL